MSVNTRRTSKDVAMKNTPKAGTMSNLWGAVHRDESGFVIDAMHPCSEPALLLLAKAGQRD